MRRSLPGLIFQITFCGSLDKAAAKTSSKTPKSCGYVPNETTITPSSSELCTNSSRSGGSGLAGPGMNGPTTLVSADKKEVRLKALSGRKAQAADTGRHD